MVMPLSPLAIMIDLPVGDEHGASSTGSIGNSGIGGNTSSSCPSVASRDFRGVGSKIVFLVHDSVLAEKLAGNAHRPVPAFFMRLHVSFGNYGRPHRQMPKHVVYISSMIRKPTPAGTRPMKTLANLVVTPLLILGAPAATSQDLTTAAAAEAFLGAAPYQAAFECAALAASAAEDSPVREEVERLFAYGCAIAKPIVSKLKAEPGFADGLGPWGHAASLSDDFWIGAFWISFNIEVTKFLEDKFPIEGGLSYFDGIRPARQSAAESEFRRRNCHLVGR
jgi:hypothetical protein